MPFNSTFSVFIFPEPLRPCKFQYLPVRSDTTQLLCEKMHNHCAYYPAKPAKKQGGERNNYQLPITKYQLQLAVGENLA